MKEALKRALDVLERYQVGKWQDFDTFEEAITTIKAALAQQEPWCMKMNGCKTKCEDCPDEPAQEPVGVFCEDDDIGYVRLIPHQQMKLKAWDKLYTTPQQCPWVGLTDDERGEVYSNWRFNGINSSNLELCKAIEAKLKEKNG